MKNGKNHYKQHSIFIENTIIERQQNQLKKINPKNLKPKSYTIIGYNYRMLYIDVSRET